MGRLATGAASVLGVALAIAWFGGIAAVEVGGISYRKDCITADGKVEKSWTFTWFAPLPFIFRPAAEGCEVHTGLRVAMNAVGIAQFAEVDVANAARKAAKDPALDDGQRYYAALYADLKDMQDYNAARPRDVKGGIRELKATSAALAELRPPTVVASTHAELVALFREAAETGDRILAAVAAGDQATVQRLGAKLQSANTRQTELLRAIATKLQNAEG
jgi:hypothetical protein